MNLRLATMTTTIKILFACKLEKNQYIFRDVIFLKFYKILLDLTKKNDTINVIKVFSYFIKMKAQEYDFALPQFGEVQNIIKRIIQDKNVSKETQEFSLKFLLTSLKNGLFINDTYNLFNSILELNFQLLVDANILNIKDWNIRVLNNEAKIRYKQFKTKKNYINLGIKQFVIILGMFVKELIKKKNWYNKCVALNKMTKFIKHVNWKTLMSLCRKIMNCHIGRHPKTKETYIRCIRTILEETKEHRFHFSNMLKKIFFLLKEKKNPNIQVQALTDLISYFIFYQKRNFIALISGLIRMVGLFFESEFISVMKHALKAVSILTLDYKISFRSLYNFFIQTLFKVIKCTKHFNEQKIKGILCKITDLLGVAVGRQIFTKDAKSFMKFTISLVKNKTVNQFYSFLVPLWLSMVKCLKKEFNVFIFFIISFIRKQGIVIKVIYIFLC